MRRLRALILTALSAAGLAAFGAAPAEAQLTSCIRRHFERAAGSPDSLGIALADAERIVGQLSTQAGVASRPTIVACLGGEMEKVQSLHIAQAAQGAPAGDYILYDPTWLREVIGGNVTEATFVFGHELGHLWKGHFGASASLSRVEKETQADESGGCAVARLHSDFFIMQGIVYRLRSETDDGQYPNQAVAIEAAKKGYLGCGGPQDVVDRRATIVAGPTLLGASLIIEFETGGRMQAEMRRYGSSFASIGYAHTVTAEELAAGHILIDGVEVSLSAPMSEPVALRLLYKDMRRISDQLNTLVKVPLTDPQRASLESLLFNVGGGRFRNSDLLRAINEGRFDDVPPLLSGWRAGVPGNFQTALQRRRDREAGMWLSGIDRRGMVATPPSPAATPTPASPPPNGQ